MSSKDFGAETAEPMVGEVTALRSFRITDDGYFLPLTDAGGHEPWPTETSSAKCNRGKPHQAPDPDCTCGFYAYGNRSWVENYGAYAWSRVVLAAVHCSGRLVAGEKGLRGEKMRLVACYVSRGVPRETFARLRENYPEVEFFTSRKALLAAHPETQLSTYIEAPKPRPLLPSLTGLQVALPFVFFPFLVYSILVPFLNPETGGFTVGQAASIAFAALIWSPFLVEALVIAKTGVPADALDSMRRVLRFPWNTTNPRAVMTTPGLRVFMVIFGLILVVFISDRPLFPFGWSALNVLALTVGTAFVVWREARRTFPLSTKFPLVPRTLAIQELRECLPADSVLSRESSHRHQAMSQDSMVEMLDMGGYGVGMVHFDIFSDPEDYPSALGIAPRLRTLMQDLAVSLGLPKNRWVAYIASEDANLRVLTTHGDVSPPVPLSEIDAILPFPTLTCCAPGVRSSYIQGLHEETLDLSDAPFTLRAGYLKRRTDAESFSNPGTANALTIARRISEQYAYRNFKQIEAHLPEGVEPVATPSLPQEEGGVSGDPEAEMSSALMTLMNSATDRSSSKSLLFAMGELIDGLAHSTNDLNEVMSIDLHAETDAPQDAEVGMKGAHLLLIGTAGTLTPDAVTPLSFSIPEGRVYAVLGKGKKSILNATLTVRGVRSERGGDDDVDALEDAGE